MHVQTQYEIVPRGADVMLLTDQMRPDQVRVTAERVDGQWTITTPHDAEVVTADNRKDALKAMRTLSVAMPPVVGNATTLIPHGLKDLP